MEIALCVAESSWALHQDIISRLETMRRVCILKNSKQHAATERSMMKPEIQPQVGAPTSSGKSIGK